MPPLGAPALGTASTTGRRPKISCSLTGAGENGTDGSMVGIDGTSIGTLGGVSKLLACRWTDACRGSAFCCGIGMKIGDSAGSSVAIAVPVVCMVRRIAATMIAACTVKLAAAQGVRRGPRAAALSSNTGIMFAFPVVVTATIHDRNCGPLTRA